MGLVHITSWCPNFNGSHFGLPPSEIHRMTGLPPKIVWAMTYSHRPHLRALYEFWNSWSYRDSHFVCSLGTLVWSSHGRKRTLRLVMFCLYVKGNNALVCTGGRKKRIKKRIKVKEGLACHYSSFIFRSLPSSVSFLPSVQIWIDHAWSSSALWPTFSKVLMSVRLETGKVLGWTLNIGSLSFVPLYHFISSVQIDVPVKLKLVDNTSKEDLICQLVEVQVVG